MSMRSEMSSISGLASGGENSVLWLDWEPPRSLPSLLTPLHCTRTWLPLVISPTRPCPRRVAGTTSHPSSHQEPTPGRRAARPRSLATVFERSSRRPSGTSRRSPPSGLPKWWFPRSFGLLRLLLLFRGGGVAAFFGFCILVGALFLLLLFGGRPLVSRRSGPILVGPETRPACPSGLVWRCRPD